MSNLPATIDESTGEVIAAPSIQVVHIDGQLKRPGFEARLPEFGRLRLGTTYGTFTDRTILGDQVARYLTQRRQHRQHLFNACDVPSVTCHLPLPRSRRRHCLQTPDT